MKVHDEPSKVEAVDGEVEVVGPGGLIVSLTPDAAAETSDRLLIASVEAQRQCTEALRGDEEPAGHPHGAGTESAS